MGIKRKIVVFLKKIYSIIPIKAEKKQRIKNKLVSKFKILRRINNYNTNMVLASNQSFADDIKFENAESLESLNRNIAIHLHLFYVDLSDEFINYFNNIPYKFDLLISVQKNADKKEITANFKRIKNVGSVIVKECENIGRDFSPMFITFKNDIKRYDYLLHVHSKKSIRTGSQQDGWRRHMLDNLVGSTEIIKKEFFQFEKGDNIGLIFPETYNDMPYWAHTWLKNTQKSNEIANRIGISICDEYIDYSVGSFFWAKVKAIEPFLDFNYTYDDFGTEQGLADGTLAHAIERMIPQVVKSAGYKYMIVDKNTKVFRYRGLKNLYQYNSKTKDECLSVLSNYDIVSFDIFDTLITRKTISPSIIFDLLSDYVNKKYNYDGFKKNRLDAEYLVRVDKHFENDCSIDEIYVKLESITSLNKKKLQDIKNKEVDLELEYTIPKCDMLEIYNELKKKKKKIILISDMYLTTKEISKMLKKCGYSNWDKLLVSSETGLRKDNGGIWDYYFKKVVKNSTSIHVGDNEQSDVQQLCDMGKPFYHVMQAKKAYGLSNYSNYLDSTSDTIGDKIVKGLIVNKRLFNSPFVNFNSYLINNPSDLGYAIFGPIFLQFFLFLEKELEKKKYDKVLFLAREGYYLEKMYESFSKSMKLKKQNTSYFLTSRRATSVACVETINDAKDILMIGYEGKMNNLFLNRLGISDASIPDKFVKTVDDEKEIEAVLSRMFDKYLEQFKDERKNYLNYSKTKFNKNDKVAVVDLGYSGTIQYYLMKMNDMKMDGYYLTLSDNIKPTKIGGNCYGCFSSSKNTEKNIFLFSMILETFLTAPYGQLIKFDNDNKPVYKDEIIDKDFFAKLDEICNGINEFITDYIETVGDEIDNIDVSNEFICRNFSSLVYVDNVLAPEIKSIFKLENSYSLDSTINVFDYLNLVYKGKN